MAQEKLNFHKEFEAAGRYFYFLCKAAKKIYGPKSELEKTKKKAESFKDYKKKQEVVLKKHVLDIESKFNRLAKKMHLMPLQKSLAKSAKADEHIKKIVNDIAFILSIKHKLRMISERYLELLRIGVKKEHLKKLNEKIERIRKLLDNKITEAFADFKALQKIEKSQGKKKRVTKAKPAKTIVKRIVRTKKYPFVGSATTKTLHRSQCKFVKMISKKNKVCFTTKRAAFKLGYTFCPECLRPKRTIKRKVAKKKTVKKRTAKKKAIKKRSTKKRAVKKTIC